MQPTRAASLLLALALASGLEAQSQTFRFPAAARASYGRSLAATGNSAGRMALAIGSPMDSSVVTVDLLPGPTARLTSSQIDSFGADVAMHQLFGSALGTTTLLAVGAPGFDQGNQQDAGRVLVYSVQNGRVVGVWNFLSTQPGFGYRFGSSVAVGLRGSTPILAVGEPYGASTGTGRVHVFAYSGGQWIAEQTLSPFGNFAQGDRFGGDIALDGNHLIVGSVGNDAGGVESGCVHMFRYDGQSWTNVRQFVPSQESWCGTSVAIDGTTAIAGSPNWSQGLGRAHVFDLAQPGAPVIHTFTGDEAGGHLGSAVDVRLGRFLLGKRFARGTGAVELHGPSPRGLEKISDWNDHTHPNFARFGTTAVFGDNRQDIAVGAPGANNSRGEVSMYRVADNPGTWFTSGTGVSGASGQDPELRASGRMLPSHRLTVDLEGGENLRPCVLCFGPLAQIPVFGGTLYVNPIVTVPTVTGPLGEARWEFLVPGNFQAPTVPRSAMQALALDSSAVQGVSMTPLLLLEHPN